MQQIQTSLAPSAIGPYSQAIKIGEMVFLSGQIPLDVQTMNLVSEDIHQQAEQIFKHLQAISEAAGGGLASIVKLTIYLTDLNDFTIVNQTMQRFFVEPYPARATIQVSALPKAAKIEVDAIMVLGL